MKKNRFLSYISFSIAFFLFFFYQTFPYSLLKEEITEQIVKKNSPWKIEAQSLRPYWITGLEFSDIKITNILNDKSPVHLDKVNARISISALLIGNFTVNINILQNKGMLETSFTFPLFSALSGHFSLSKAHFSSHAFLLNNIFHQILSIAGSSNDSNMMLISPLISKMTVGGELNGEINYIYNKSLKVNLFLNDFNLNINNDLLKIPIQKFSDARVKFSWDEKRITFNKDDISFKAPNISFHISGFLEDTENSHQGLENMNADANLHLSMFGELEKSFGFLLPQLLKCPPSAMVDGVMNVKLAGPVNRLMCSKQ